VSIYIGKDRVGCPEIITLLPLNNQMVGTLRKPYRSGQSENPYAAPQFCAELLPKSNFNNNFLRFETEGEEKRRTNTGVHS